ncbi:hypothetical protein GQ53DRAFT_888818 [Thozetella sp. PMI_491]|nr:hypothetical protein GQ53DRAFT_888818 [Thozetella sp. PMI_491]
MTLQNHEIPARAEYVADTDRRLADKSGVQPTTRDVWHFPTDFDQDLEGVGLSPEVIAETLACAWEYTRCVIPQYTNWGRYISFVRIVAVGIVAEFRGDLVDIVVTDDILGYNIQDLIDGCYGDTPGHELMGREYRAYLLFTAEKACHRRDSELFRRYVNALARSPRDWFRLRDCDALIRFTAAAALSANDFCDTWFSETEWEALAELSAVLYDSVAFYKHRTEGETNSTFAYFPHEVRGEYYRRCRELLWALDAAWAKSPAHLYVVNFIRFFGGPIHMMMRRYRFVEENLTIGRPETDHVVEQARKNFKLWNRMDATGREAIEADRFVDVVNREAKLLYPGLVNLLWADEEGECNYCQYRTSYGAYSSHQFGGVQLCDSCQNKWREYMEDVVVRTTKGFPILAQIDPSSANISLLSS